MFISRRRPDWLPEPSPANYAMEKSDMEKSGKIRLGQVEISRYFHRLAFPTISLPTQKIAKDSGI